MDLLDITMDTISSAENDNIEVLVRTRTGERYWATFITLDNIRSLFEKNARTGEHAGGTYFPVASNMILTRLLTRSVVETTIRDLLETGEFSSIFTLLPAPESRASTDDTTPSRAP